MNARTKRILKGILFGVCAVIIVLLIVVLCRYKYWTTLHLAYDAVWGDDSGNFDTSVNSRTFPVREDSEETVLLMKGAVTQGNISVALYRIGDNPDRCDWDFDVDPGESDTASLIYQVSFSAGDSIDVDEALGPLKRGAYIIWIDQSEDIELRYWQDIDTYNTGWIIDKYHILNKLRKFGILKDREDEED